MREKIQEKKVKLQTKNRQSDDESTELQSLKILHSRMGNKNEKLKKTKAKGIAQ